MPPPKSAARVSRCLTVNRWIALVVIAQLSLVIYFFSFSTIPSRPHHYIVEDPNTYTSKHNFIIVGILSDRVSADRRQAVRDTWLHFYKFGLGYAIQAYILAR